MRHIGSNQPTGRENKTGGVLNLENSINYEPIRQLVIQGHKCNSQSTAMVVTKRLCGMKRIKFIMVLQNFEKMRKQLDVK